MHADLLDLLILVVGLSAAVGGFRLGFLARAVSWLGLAVGLIVAARLLPTLVGAVRNSNPTGKLLVAALVLLGGMFIGQALGLIVGARVHAILPFGPLRTIDDGVGAALGVLGVLGLVWLLLPSMASVPGWPARQARNSTVARWVDRSFPPPPHLLEALRGLVGNQAFPQVFNALAPSINTGPPPADSGLTPAQQASVSASTVKVAGDACRRIQEGSGWTVIPGYVLTNAHVVAGERRSSVLLPSGRTLPAIVVAFDASRDLALLEVPFNPEPVLPLVNDPATTAAEEHLVGTKGAVFGHPGGQDPLAITPFLVRQFVSAIGRDLYDQHDTKRNVYVLASNLAPGDSGGAVVDQAGEVIAVAFAIAPDRPGTSYALSYTEVRSFLVATRSAAAGQVPTSSVSTGPCLND
jgi:S1-C subfamily serine protease